VQMRLLKAVHKSGKPIVLVLTGGSALDVAWAEENVPAILLCWYPGQAAGTALADVLLGKYNPAGRLPVTFYRSVDQLPPFEDYRMRGRTYRFFEGRVLYPFGFGLSYTRFSYGNLEIHPTEVSSGGKVWVSADVTNAGSVAGDEVVQVYVTDVQASVPVPLRQLAGFARFSFAPGQKRRVTFVLNAEQMACVGDDGRRMIEPGYFEVTVGGGQTHEKTVGNVLVGRFAVRE